MKVSMFKKEIVVFVFFLVAGTFSGYAFGSWQDNESDSIGSDVPEILKTESAAVVRVVYTVAGVVDIVTPTGVVVVPRENIFQTEEENTISLDFDKTTKLSLNDLTSEGRNRYEITIEDIREGDFLNDAVVVVDNKGNTKVEAASFRREQ